MLFIWNIYLHRFDAITDGSFIRTQIFRLDKARGTKHQTAMAINCNDAAIYISIYVDHLCAPPFGSWTGPRRERERERWRERDRERKKQKSVAIVKGIRKRICRMNEMACRISVVYIAVVNTAAASHHTAQQPVTTILWILTTYRALTTLLQQVDASSMAININTCFHSGALLFCLLH